VPRRETEGVKIGDTNIGVLVQHSRRVSPIVSAVLMLGGAGMVIARWAWSCEDLTADEFCSDPRPF